MQRAKEKTWSLMLETSVVGAMRVSPEVADVADAWAPEVGDVDNLTSTTPAFHHTAPLTEQQTADLRSLVTVRRCVQRVLQTFLMGTLLSIVGLGLLGLDGRVDLPIQALNEFVYAD